MFYRFVIVGDRHSDVLHRQSEEFMQRLQQLDAKFTDSEGKRNQMLMEMVEKVKEHVRLLFFKFPVRRLSASEC